MAHDRAASVLAPLAARVLGSRPISGASARATPRRLRILAYHDVADAQVFGAHVEELANRWHPVSGEEVADAVEGGPRLPERAVWVTFDDGRPGTVDRGLAALERWGVPATMYVCPGVIESADPYWWDQLEARPDRAVELDGRRLAGPALVTALKRVDDGRRRRIVADVSAAPATLPVAAPLDRSRLRRWATSGREVGNHTWDHPVLDRCTPDQQEDQIDRAHAWLTVERGRAPTLFAYPNGDRTAHAAAHLAGMGYRSAPVFDHRLVARSPQAFALSRLRIDADASPVRLRAILSGVHSGLFHLISATPGERRGRG